MGECRPLRREQALVSGHARQQDQRHGFAHQAPPPQNRDQVNLGRLTYSGPRAFYPACAPRRLLEVVSAVRWGCAPRQDAAGLGACVYNAPASDPTSFQLKADIMAEQTRRGFLAGSAL